MPYPKEKIWNLLASDGFSACPRNCAFYKPSKVWSDYGATEVAEELAECTIPSVITNECPRLVEET